MPIEVESPEQLGYDTITNNLSESSVADRRLADLGIDFGADGAAIALDELLLCYGDHLGDPVLREAVAAPGVTTTCSGPRPAPADATDSRSRWSPRWSP